MIRATLVLFFVHFSTGQFPPDWKKCVSSDLECLRGAAQYAINSLADGNEALGIAPLEGVLAESIPLLDGKDGKGKLTYRSIKINGLSKISIPKIELLGNNGLRVHFKGKKWDIAGKYEMNANLMGIPMTGDGDITMSFDNLEGTCDLFFEMKKIENKSFYDVTKAVLIDFKVDDFHVHHYNLFNGNKQLEESVNKALNDDWKTLFKELLGYGKAAFSEIFLRVSKGVLDKIPSDQFELPVLKG